MAQTSHDDILQRAQKGEHEAFVELLVDYDCEELITKAIRDHCALMQKFVGVFRSAKSSFLPATKSPHECSMVG
jgi:hypothetical protein